MSRETNENPDESSTPSREKQLFSSYAAGRVTKKSQLLIIPIALKIPLEGKTGGAPCDIAILNSYVPVPHILVHNADCRQAGRRNGNRRQYARSL
jgi:hypothetical protein